jgi:hypothetical protein
VNNFTCENIYGNSLRLSEDIYVGGALYTSTIQTRGLAVGGLGDSVVSSAVANGWVYVDGNIYNNGNFWNQGNMQIDGSFRVAGSAYFSSQVTIGGGVVYNQAQILYSSILAANDCTILAGQLDVGGDISTTSIQCSELLHVNQSTTATAIATNRLVVSNAARFSTVVFDWTAGQDVSGINIGSNQISYSTNTSGIFIGGGVITPAVSTTTLHSDSATVGTLRVNTSILATTLQQFQMEATQIVNPGGSLVIQDISCQTIRASTLSTQTLASETIVTSTIDVTSYLFVNTVDTNLVDASYVNISYFSTINGNINDLQCSTMSVSTLYITDTLNLAAIPSYIDLSHTILCNTFSETIVSSIYTNTLTASTLYASNISFSPIAVQIVSPSTFVSTLLVSTLSASTINVDLMAANQVYLGTRPPVLSSNYLAFGSALTTAADVRGDGSQFQPVIVSNIAPISGAYVASYTLNSPLVNISTQPSSNVALVLQYVFTPNSNSSTNVTYSVATGVGTSNTYTLLGANGQQTSTINYACYGATTTPFSWTMNSADASGSFVIEAYVKDSNYSFLQPNTSNGVFFNSGILRWNYSVNSVTIDNPYNDMLIRNINYYGNLNFFSDPAIKENIEDADVGRCAEIIEKLPLRYYKFKDDYISEFHIHDRHRLGFLANEVAEFFPHSVTPSRITLAGQEMDIKTVDFQQIKMAHIGATKDLMRRIEALEHVLE